MQEMLKITGIRKSFSTLDVLKGVDLTVHKGEVVSLIGPSGSGKTTLLRCANFLDQAEDGTMVLDGQTYHLGHVRRTEMYEARRHTAFVFQNYNLFPHYTVMKNIIDAPIRVLKRPREQAEARARELIAQMGLTGNENKVPCELSGGQQQRTSIARALINNPSLVLADEPTGNLDSKSSEEVMSMLKMCNQSYGQTVIMITHNLDIAKQADRIITISDGKIVEEA